MGDNLSDESVAPFCPALFYMCHTILAGERKK